MNDPYSGRDDTEAAEGLSAPFQKPVSLFVAFELHLGVSLICRFAARKIDLDRVIDDKIDRHKRLDDRDVLTHSKHSRAHRRKIYQKRHAGEILQDNPGHDERDLFGSLRLCLPSRQSADAGFTYLLAAVETALPPLSMVLTD